MPDLGDHDAAISAFTMAGMRRIYALRNASRPLVEDEQSPSVKGPDETAPRKAIRMLPVRVVGSPALKAREGEAELLELALPSGARMRFPAGTDLRYLQQLAGAL